MEDKLAEEILDGAVKSGDTVSVTAGDGGLLFCTGEPGAQTVSQ